MAREKSVEKKTKKQEVAIPFKSMDEIFALLDNAPTNIMYCDRSFIIRYININSLNTLKTIEHILPVKADAVCGQSIDVFHKNPAHQQRLMSDDANLPFRATVTIGNEKLDLLATAIYDADKQYIGVMVTWDVITKKLELDTKLARIQSMMENVPINLMLADLDLRLIYMNPRSRDTLMSIEHLLPMKVDHMIGQIIDVFHKNPENARRVALDPSKLPYTTKINLAGQVLQLVVSPIFDDARKFLGPMVTWEVITSRVQLI